MKKLIIAIVFLFVSTCLATEKAEASPAGWVTCSLYDWYPTGSIITGNGGTFYQVRQLCNWEYSDGSESSNFWEYNWYPIAWFFAEGVTNPENGPPK